MSVGEPNIRHDASSDDGELTDESATDRRSRTGHTAEKSSRSSSSASERQGARSTSKAKEEEDRLRRNLLAKHSSKSSYMHSSEDDEQEMFTMQPGDSNSSRLSSRLEKVDKNKTERDKKDKDRDRDHRDRHDRHHKHKQNRRDRERDRHSERDRHDRESRTDRDRHDDRENRDRDRHDDHKHKSKSEDRRLTKPLSIPSHDRTERHKNDRIKEEREKKDERPRDKDKSTRKHKRTPTGSSSPESERKRERKEDNSKEKKEEEVKTRTQKLSETKSEVSREVSRDVSREVSREVSDESDEEKTPVASQEIRDPVEQLKADFEDDDEEEPPKEITSFVLDCPAGPKYSKYSKFDSSPEPDELASPEQSDVEEMGYSEVEEEEKEPELDFDPETAKVEELTEEQKCKLSPDTRQRMEDDYQKRLVAQLPVFYPGIMGCRNVQEFECVNRVEEGTYGVVFRARDKRTDEIVALKRLKMEKEREGFPITSLREVNMLLKAGSHENIVNIKEILIGSSMDKIYVAMEFVEHDIKSLMDTMSKKGKRFTIGEQKTLMRQLLAGLAHMHHLWILHRDLKSSNLLLSHKGVLKIADFGLAREFGSPLKPYTSIVVTLWYRSPELLLGKKLYSTPVDMWSVGCLMAEFQLLKPLFPGKGEMDQIKLIFQQLGTPTKEIWEEYDELPLVKQVALDKYPYNQLRKKFPISAMNDTGFKLLNEFLRYDPELRISAEAALKHPWFTEDPKPTPTDMFPTFPAKSEQHKPPPNTRKREVPIVDINPETAKLLAEFKVRPEQMKAGFSLKYDKAKFL